MNLKRYSDFLNESGEVDKETLMSIVNTLKTECKPFFDELRENNITDYILRGTRDDIDNIKRKSVRKDRSSNTIDPYTVKDIDNEFFGEFGIKPRTQASFATGSYSDAQSYGEPYLFFPIGEYSYIWSKFVKDMWINVREMPRKNDYDRTSEYERDIEDMVSGYQMDDLSEAIRSGNEIMFVCEEYFFVNGELGYLLREHLFNWND